MRVSILTIDLSRSKIETCQQSTFLVIVYSPNDADLLTEQANGDAIALNLKLHAAP